jgi:hypothetical protein
MFKQQRDVSSLEQSVFCTAKNAPDSLAAAILETPAVYLIKHISMYLPEI